jgi:hypothetical protein
MSWLGRCHWVGPRVGVSFYFKSRGESSDTKWSCVRGYLRRGKWTLFYYKSRKRELKTRLIHEDRCDERLKNQIWGIYTSHIHWFVPFLLSYTLRYVNFAEVRSVCRVALREPMYLCTCVSEEGDDGKIRAQKCHLWCHTHLDTSVSLTVKCRFFYSYYRGYTEI